MRKTNLAPDQTRLSESEILHMRDYVQVWTYKHLIQTTDIPRVEATLFATRAANKYAQELVHATTKTKPAAAAPHCAIRPDVNAVKTILDRAIESHDRKKGAPK